MCAAERLEISSMSKKLQETRIALMEQANGHIQDNLKRFDERFGSLEDSIDKKFIRIEDHFKSLRTEMLDTRKEGWIQMRWILLFLIGFMGSPLVESLIKLIHIG